MMPPHATRVVPTPGEKITDPVVVVHGYSLGYASDPTVEDETLGAGVPCTLDLQTEAVGRGLASENPPPGSIQQSCVLTIRFPALEAGHTYRLDYLGRSFTWTAATGSG